MAKEAIVKSPSGRVKRASNVVRNRLSVHGQDPDYVYRIVNDDDDRIPQLMEAGYELVQSKDVKVGDKRVGDASPEGSAKQLSVGGGMKAFVMRIKKEWYYEDQAVKQRDIDALEATTKNKALDGTYGKLDFSRD